MQHGNAHRVQPSYFTIQRNLQFSVPLIYLLLLTDLPFYVTYY